MLNGLSAVAASLGLGLGLGSVQVLQPTDVSVWTDTVTVMDGWSEAAFEIAAARPDPVAEQIVQQYLQNLAAQGLSVSDQSVWLQVGDFPVVRYGSDVPLPAASLTKVATTLAALSTWGPDHQFQTVIATTGPINNGVLQGDLLVLSEGDPLFVWEEAIALGNTLQQAGIQRVTGRLLVTPAFTMNFEPNPAKSAQLLQQALDAQQWNWEAEQQYTTLPAGTARPAVQIEGETQVISPTAPLVQSAQPLIRHQSLSLAAILKSMNIYSNNEMSEQVARLVGGSDVVIAKAAKAAGMPASEIRLINGSGLGVENQISARAVVAMFQSVQEFLEPSGLNVGDLFPVAGRDGGTLEYRQIPVTSAVKTGTLNAVCTLGGVLPTRDRGLVWFAILNQGTNIEGLRAQQDVLLQTLRQHWGVPTTVPEDIQPSVFNDDRFQLGAASRNQIINVASLRNDLGDDAPAADDDGLVF